MGGDAPKVAMLGDLQLRGCDGVTVPAARLRTAKTRHLLRLLALEVEQPVPVEVLTAALWPEAERTRALASLRTAASQLRQTFAGGHLTRAGDALMLSGVEVDVVRFRQRAGLARRGFDGPDPAVGLHHADTALRIYRGHLAVDEPYLEALQAPAAQLAFDHQHLLVESAVAAAQLGRFQAAVELAERALAADGASERACVTLITVLVELGERAAALRAFDRCRRQLADELGVMPSPSLQALHHDLLVGTSRSWWYTPEVTAGVAAVGG